MRQKTIITKLLQSVTEVYYKVRQVLQSVTDCYYKVCQLLQSVTVITKWGVTEYVEQNETSTEESSEALDDFFENSSYYSKKRKPITRLLRKIAVIHTNPST